MTLPPDDLPRSPTGRVPEWVVHEAAGGRVEPSPWREHATWAASTPPRRRRRRPVRPVLTTALALSLLAAGVTTVGLSPDRGQAIAQTLEGWAIAVRTSPPLLPAAENRTFPVPGFEESADRLAPAPGAVAASTSYVFADTRTGPAGEPVPVTWSPCRPIHYVIDPTGAPPDLAAHVATALAEITAASGLVFADDGVTTEAATLDRSAFQPTVYGDRWAPVLIRFTDATTVPELAGDVAGLGGGTAFVDPLTGTRHYVSGLVYLDADVLSAPATPDGPAYLGILRHELGHLVGLGHVDDAAQLMHAQNLGQGTFQAGDLAGLAALGQGPCASGV